jgi:hypothetical protein
MLQIYVSSVSDVLEYVASVLYHVAKIMWDVAHVAMVIHVYFKCIFHLFQKYVTSVLSGCCKC